MKKTFVLTISILLLAVSVEAQQRANIYGPQGRRLGYISIPSQSKPSSSGGYFNPTGMSFGSYRNPFGEWYSKREVTEEDLKKGWVPLWMREENGEDAGFQKGSR